MKPAYILYLGLAGLALPLWAQTVQFTEDFSAYPDGADGHPVWETDLISWEVIGGKLQASGPTTIAYMAQQPRFSKITVEAVVTVRKATGQDWKVAAVCLFSDLNNYWHFALAEKPDAAGGGHFCELTEMREGSWLAQSNLQARPGNNNDLDWDYETPYRLRIQMTPEGIDGYVSSLDGEQIKHMGYEFTAPAVTAGRPALRAGGFLAEFDDVTVSAEGPVPDAPAKERTYPPLTVEASDLFQAEATGFYRTEKRGDRWWVVDPEGRCFYAIGTDHCRYSGHGCQKLGYAPYKRNNDAKWDSPDAWGDQATERLKSWGFNLLGAGNGAECRYKGLGHTDFVAFGTRFSEIDDICPKTTWTGFPNVFSPRWPQYCDRVARRLCTESKNDPWLFGYFLDNELEWYGKSHTETGLFEEAMLKPADHTAKRALVEYLKDKYPGIEALNAAWGASVESYDALLRLDALHGTNLEAVREDKIGFVRLIAEEYFRHTTAAIRRADPNHMVIGCRFAGRAPADIWDICGNYCDIVSFNSYDMVDLERGEAPGVVDRFDGFHELAGKPMMLTEWSFPALDSGLPCTHGAGMRVDTQEQRAEAFRIYQEMLMRLPYMVGSDFFMWVDEPAEGISETFPENSNYGLVDVNDRPYPELTQMATRVHGRAYALHNGDDPELGVTEDLVIYNRGRAAATFDVQVYVDGKSRTVAFTLEPGEEKPLGVALPEEPGAHLIAVEVDPDKETSDGLRSDNLAVKQFWVRGAGLPDGVKGPAALVALANRGPVAAGGIAAVVPLAALPEALRSAPAGDLLAAELTGAPARCQVVGEDVLVGVSGLDPWACSTLVLWRGEAPAYFGPEVKLTRNQDAEILDNGRLAFERGLPATGNVADRVLLDGTVLGAYNPLVWQDVDGQQQWVRASEGVSATYHVGSVCAVMDVVSRGGEGETITLVDEEGQQEAQRVRPIRFEVSHRVLMYPDRNWCLAKLNYITNLSDRDMTLKGYFFYLHGMIGGDPAGDVPEGPEDVPMYYALAGGTWVDEQVGMVYGGLPTDDVVAGRFWLDPGGGQHPDLRRQLPIPLTVKAGETYTDEARPWVLIFGGSRDETSSKTLKSTARAIGAVKATVEEGR